MAHQCVDPNDYLEQFESVGTYPLASRSRHLTDLTATPDTRCTKLDGSLRLHPRNHSRGWERLVKHPLFGIEGFDPFGVPTPCDAQLQNASTNQLLPPWIFWGVVSGG